jgi:hypothetical protein
MDRFLPNCLLFLEWGDLPGFFLLKEPTWPWFERVQACMHRPMAPGMEVKDGVIISLLYDHI